jgi:hypothetical protein
MTPQPRRRARMRGFFTMAQSVPNALPNLLPRGWVEVARFR